MNEYTDEENECMLHNDRVKIVSNSDGSKKCFKIIAIIITILLIGSLVVLKNVDSEYLDLKNYINNINCNKGTIKDNDNQFQVEGFVSLFKNGTKGPITTNELLDDGKKKNIYSKIIENNEENFNNFYYDIQKFLDLPSTIEKDEMYFCESRNPFESFTEDISCPEHYVITIDDAYYGRREDDKKHCILSSDGKEADKVHIEVNDDCGSGVKDKVQKSCDGRTTCTLEPNPKYYGDTCPGIIKYLQVKYHCTKTKEIKKPKFAVIMYADNIESNSIYEHAVSEFYQYSDIHGYKFILNTKKYDDERKVFYMKLYVVQEAIIEGLKNKEYDWVFWVDGDVTLANPNIKLETFLPKDNNVNLIIAADHHGINAGVFLIRVCSWSLNYMARSIAYQYSRPDLDLEYADQTSMNNVLLEGKDEKKHYVIVPQNWFNVYPGWKRPGDMIVHFAGHPDKDADVVKFNEELDKDESYLSAITNESLRKEVLEYYDLPREQQGVTFMDNDNTKEKQY